MKAKTTHIIRGKGALCNGSEGETVNWVITSDITKVTCNTCFRNRNNQLSTQLKTIDRIVHNKAIDVEEIFQALNDIERIIERYKDIERCRGILEICNVVQSRLFSNEELVEAFKSAIVKATMEE